MSKYLTLEEYDNISISFIKNNKLPCNIDNITFVNEMMIKADMKYKDNVTGSSRKDFRLLYARYAVKNIKKNFCRNKTKNKKFVPLDCSLEKLNYASEYILGSLEYKEIPGNQYQYYETFIKISKGVGIKEKDVEVIRQIMFSGSSLIDIAESLNISRQNLNATIRRIEKKAPWIKEILT